MTARKTPVLAAATWHDGFPKRRPNGRRIDERFDALQTLVLEVLEARPRSRRSVGDVDARPRRVGYDAPCLETPCLLTGGC